MLFWDKYFDWGCREWTLDQTPHRLARLMGVTSQRAIHALGEFNEYDKSSLAFALTERFKAPLLQRKLGLTAAQSEVLARFDILRQKPSPVEVLPHFARERLSKDIKKAFTEAARTCLGDPPLTADQPEVSLSLQLPEGWLLETTLSFGGKGRQMLYWHSLKRKAVILNGLGFCGRLGLSGGTEWNLIANRQDIDDSALLAREIWSEEIAQMKRLIAEGFDVRV